MTITDKHLNEIGTRLQKLEAAGQIAFAAWCCERIYARGLQSPEYSEVPSTLAIRDWLNRIWGHICGDVMPDSEVKKLMVCCEEFGTEEWEICGSDPLGNTASALWLTLDACLKRTPASALVPAEILLEEIEAAFIDSNTTKLSFTAGELRLLQNQAFADLAMQNELQLMRQTTGYLETHGKLTNDEVLQLQAAAKLLY